MEFIDQKHEDGRDSDLESESQTPATSSCVGKSPTVSFTAPDSLRIGPDGTVFDCGSSTPAAIGKVTAMASSGPESGE